MAELQLYYVAVPIKEREGQKQHTCPLPSALFFFVVVVLTHSYTRKNRWK